MTSELAAGVSIVRVHDVAEMADVVKITNAISSQAKQTKTTDEIRSLKLKGIL